MWQPIDSAPKNGQEVLLAVSNGTQLYVTMALWSVKSEWIDEPDWVDDYGHRIEPGRATHWMPLPELPMDINASQVVEASHDSVLRETLLEAHKFINDWGPDDPGERAGRTNDMLAKIAAVVQR